MWFLYTIISSVFGAVAFVMAKHHAGKIRNSVVNFSQSALAPFFLLLFLVFSRDLPRLDPWFFLSLIASSTLYTFVALFRLRIFQRNTLSSIFPLTSLNTLFTYILGLIFLNENVRPLSFAGIILIIAGTYILNFSRADKNIFKPFLLLFKNRGALIYLVLMGLISVVALFEKIALKYMFPVNSILVTLVENSLIAFVFAAFLFSRRINPLPAIKNHFAPLFASSIFFIVSGIFGYLAFAGAPLALVVAIFKSKVVFVLFLGWIFFGDKPGKKIWLGTILMIIGAILIKME